MKRIAEFARRIWAYWFGHSEPPERPPLGWTKDNYWGGWGRPGM